MGWASANKMMNNFFMIGFQDKGSLKTKAA